MGEARRRGSYDERKTQAIHRDNERLEALRQEKMHQKPLSRKELNTLQIYNALTGLYSPYEVLNRKGKL